MLQINPIVNFSGVKIIPEDVIGYSLLCRFDLSCQSMPVQQTLGIFYDNVQHLGGFRIFVRLIFTNKRI
jgi:hypothetical protein